jgi:uncharacterized membrane protein YkvA (DUF1232 family)
LRREESDVPFKLTFELGDSDLEHYREIMREAGRRAVDREEKGLLAATRQLIEQVRKSTAPEFVRKRLGDLETLIGMLEDGEWGLEGEDRERVVTGIAYFSDPLDLIPDSVPGLGFLDDAVMVELIVRDLQHEVEAYRDFCRYREKREQSVGKTSSVSREEWLSAKREQMFLRMRRRRDERRRHGYSGPLILRYRN